MDDFSELKTLYTIIDEHGEKTTITLEKWVADVLQLELGAEVHARVQAAYNKVLNERPHLTRRQRGDVIREMSAITARRYPEAERKIRGFSSQDLLDDILRG